MQDMSRRQTSEYAATICVQQQQLFVVLWDAELRRQVTCACQIGYVMCQIIRAVELSLALSVCLSVQPADRPVIALYRIHAALRHAALRHRVFIMSSSSSSSSVIFSALSLKTNKSASSLLKLAVC